MSYILDALRKAEAERNTGNAPGRHLPQQAAPAAVPSVRRAPWPWIAAGALAAVILGVTAAGYVRLASPPRPAPVAQAAQTPPAPSRRMEPAMNPASAAIARQEAKAPPEASKHEPQQPPAPPPIATAAAAKDTPVTPPAAASIVALGDLPDALRRQIPPLKVGGYIYSANRAERSVLINDRLLAEGDEAAPGLILEQMRPDGMVMRFRGVRYRMGY